MRASTSFSIAEAAHADTFKHSFEYSSFLPRGVVVLSSVTEWRVNEQAIRSCPGDPGSVASEDIGARAAAQLGHRTALEAGFWRRSPGQRRLTLSSAAQTGAGRLDNGRVKTDRKQSASQVLLASSLGKEAVDSGSASGGCGWIDLRVDRVLAHELGVRRPHIRADDLQGMAAPAAHFLGEELLVLCRNPTACPKGQLYQRGGCWLA